MAERTDSAKAPRAVPPQAHSQADVSYRPTSLEPQGDAAIDEFKATWPARKAH